MSSVTSIIKKPEVAMILAMCAGAGALASAHLTKLATDPHTMYVKNVEHRRWDQKLPSRYMAVSWNEVMEKRK
jgi:hypothetical protein